MDASGGKQTDGSQVWYGSKHLQVLPKAEPCITICSGNLDRGRTLREAVVWRAKGVLPELLPTPRIPSLVLEKASFPLGRSQVQGLVSW